MKESLTLTMKEQQRSEVVGRWLGGVVTTGEAVALLGCSERTAWRLRAAMLARGAAGLAHGNRGRASSRRLPGDVRARICELARTTYRGYNDTHLAEALAEDEGIAVGRSSLRRLLRAEGLASPRKRRPPRYRSRRERMAQAGLLVQVDGSHHDWLEGRGPTLTLVGGIDDATGVVVGATFRDAEDGVGYLTVLREMARRHGLPAALYRDGSTIFAPNAVRHRERDEATQVGRALAELGIATIVAGSPQAKGRIERLWGTFQDRLVSELRRAGAADRASANAVLRGFLPRFNRRFAVSPASDVPAWRPVPEGLDLARVCAFRWRRTVGSDSCVRSRVRSSSSRQGRAAAPSPVGGWRSSSGSTAACSCSPRDASSPPCRRPRSRVGCARSGPSTPPGHRRRPPAGTSAIVPGPTILGTDGSSPRVKTD